jgi:hypothetical protein
VNGLRTGGAARDYRMSQPVCGARETRTPCSPSPLPSPSWRGRIVSRALRNLTRQMYSSGGVRGSLSFGERAGVRGNRAYSNRTSQTFARTVALLESPNRDGASRRIP